MNTTISGNTALTSGGGVSNTGGMAITHTTLSSNTAPTGGGIANAGAVTVNHTIIANSLAGGDCNGPITTLGYNLDSDGACNLIGLGDTSGVDPLLASLKNNGGATETHALLPSSPAINVGDIFFLPPPDFDQRGVGFPRQVGVRIDIGSFEDQP